MTNADLNEILDLHQSEANNFHRVDECGRINGLNEEG